MDIEIDVSDVQRVCREADEVAVAGARRAVGVAARTGVAEAVAQKTYEDRTGKLSRTARGRVVSANKSGAEAEMTWPVPYASFVDQDTKPHVIEAKPGGVLAFPAGGGTRFARRVQHPGTTGKHFADKASEVAERVLEAEAEATTEEIRRILEH